MHTVQLLAEAMEHPYFAPVRQLEQQQQQQQQQQASSSHALHQHAAPSTSFLGQQLQDGEDTILPDACTTHAPVTIPAPVAQLHAPKGPAVAAVSPPLIGPGAVALPG